MRSRSPRPTGPGEASHVRGSAFIEGEFHGAEKLVSALSRASSPDQVRALCRRLNGHHALIARRQDSVLVAVDQIQSIPLFYACDERGVVIADDAHAIESKMDPSTPSRLSLAEYTRTGYVSGTGTLHPDIRQVTAGAVATIDLSTVAISHQQHHDYLPGIDPDPEAQLLSEYGQVLTASFDWLIEYANGRPIVVHLTSGYDSRSIAIMLIRGGYDPLIACVTDVPLLGEADIAADVAEKLGLDRIVGADFSPSHDDYRRWHFSGERAAIEANAGTLHRYPRVDRGLLFERARQRGDIPSDAVIVDGGTARTTGEWLPPNLVGRPTTRRELVAAILEHTTIRGHADRP